MTVGRFEFAVLSTLYIFAGVYFEERNLYEELGEKYAHYRKNVPMWIPGIKPWRGN